MTTKAQFQTQIASVMGGKRSVMPVDRATFYSPNANGDCTVADRPGYAYALIGGAIAVVRAAKMSPVEGLPFFASKPDIGAGGVRDALDVDYDGIDGWDGTSYDVPPHQHDAESGTPISVVDSQVLIGLATANDPPDAYVTIPEFYYHWKGAIKRHEAVITTTMLGSLPASERSRWVTLSIDGDDNTYTITVGSDFEPQDPDPQDYYPTVPAGEFCVGDIRLESTSTVILQTMIDGRRRLLLDTSGAGGVVNGAANEVAFFDTATSVTSSPRITRAASGDLLTVTSGATSDVPLTVAMFAGQTNLPFQVLTSAGNLSASFTASGDINTYGTGGSYTSIRFANASSLSQIRVNGSIGAESGVLSGESLSTFVARSYNGGTFPAYTTVGVGGFSVLAAENHGAGAFGSYFRITTTPTGSASAAVRLIVSANGNTIVGTTTEAGTSAVRTFAIHNSVAPSTSPPDMVQLSAVDIDGAGTRALAIRDELGNVTELGKWAKLPGGLRQSAYAVKSANYTLTLSDYTIEVDTGSTTMTLPTAVSVTGQTFQIINCSSGTVTVATTSSQTIGNKTTGNPTSIPLASEERLQVVSNGTNWRII